MTKLHFSLKTKLALLITIILWASAFVGIRAGLKGYSPGGLAAVRFVIAAICLSCMCLYLPQRQRIAWRDKGLMLLLGAFGLGCYNIALNYGELSVSAGIASFIISQSPVITAFLAIIFLEETFNYYLFLGTFISILGVGLITLGHAHQYSASAGIIDILIATLVGGVYSVAQKPLLKKYHALEVTAYIIWGSALSLLIFLPSGLHEMRQASAWATFSVVYLAVFPAAIGYAMWSYALQDIPASRAASFLYFLPVIALFLGWICLGEVPAMLSIVGGLIALVGVWVVNHSHRRRPIKIS